MEKLEELDKQQLIRLVMYLKGKAGLHPDWMPDWANDDV